MERLNVGVVLKGGWMYMVAMVIKPTKLERIFQLATSRARMEVGRSCLELRNGIV